MVGEFHLHQAQRLITVEIYGPQTAKLGWVMDLLSMQVLEYRRNFIQQNLIYYTQSEEKDAGQGNQSGYAALYERDLGEVGIGLKYDQISISEIKEGGSTLILGYDQTLIKLEGTIKIDESLNGRVQFQKHRC